MMKEKTSLQKKDCLIASAYATLKGFEALQKAEHRHSQVQIAARIDFRNRLAF